MTSPSNPPAGDGRLPRMAVFDLDGTLLDSSYQLRDRTAAALGAISEGGVIIVLATGRPVGGVVGLLDGHHGDFVVGSNGRELYSYETGHHDVFDDFALDLALAAGRAMRRRIDGLRLAVFTDDGVWADAGWSAIVPEPGPFGPVGDALLATGRFALRVGAFHPDRRAETYLDEARAVLPEGVDATVSGLDSLDIVPAGSDKAVGVRRLAKQLGIGRKDVIAFGDNLNDHDLLRWAGRGVAMGNADAATLAVADEVTRTNDEDGVAAVLEALLA